jgi:hypothetical protein
LIYPGRRFNVRRTGRSRRNNKRYPVLSEGEYFLSEGIKGAGEMPEWYNPTKYKSVAEQAKAYNELERKFGGFTGAPKDGYAGPEGVESGDALLEELTEFATRTNMSQDAFNDAWELLTAQSEAVEQVEQEQELAKLGDNAQQRIKTIEGFMKNNMSPEDFDVARDLVTTAESVQLIEMLVAATAPTKLPIQGGESPTGVTWADIEAEMFKKHENGQLLRSVDTNHERKIQKMMHDYGGDMPHHQTIG